LIAIGRGVGEHDLTRQGDDVGRIVVLAERMQIVQVPHQRRTRSTWSSPPRSANSRGRNTSSPRLRAIRVSTMFRPLSRPYVPGPLQERHAGEAERLFSFLMARVS